MIRNELKDKLPEGWREKFVHRDCDQANYEFAMFEIDGENKILVRNPDTDDIMEYYYDDFDGKISMSGFIESMGYKEQDKRKYYIDRDYNWYSNDTFLRNVGYVLPPKRLIYPQIGITTNKKSVRFLIHRLIATIFVPNRDNIKYTIVNHKNSDTRDSRAENLEWCDQSYNNKKENKSSCERNSKYINKTTNKILEKDEIIRNLVISESRFYELVRKNLKDKNGDLWEKFDPTIEDYLSRHSINPSGWYEDNGLHNFGKHKVRANSCGVLEVDGKLTIGYKTRRMFYRIKIGDQSLQVHRLVYEIINKKLIDPKNVIDHKVPVSPEDINNEYTNLAECTQKENMNNPQTLKKLSQPVKVFSLSGELVKEFSSYGDAAKGLGLYGKESVGIYFNNGGKVCGGRILLRSEESLEDKLKFIYYKFDPFGKLMKSETSFTKLLKSRGQFPTYKKYLNTGMPAPDGYYYQQGDPQNMIYDPDNKDLIKKRPEIFWKDRNKNREDN
jgi:hypothetical protein